MKEYRLQWTEIEEIACDHEIFTLALFGLLYSDYDLLKNATMCNVYYRRTIATFVKYNKRSRENKISGQCGRNSQFRAIKGRDRIGMRRLARWITRGVPWGSPRQASPTNSHRRVRSRLVDLAHLRWGSVNRSVVLRYSSLWFLALHSRSSSSVVRCPCVDDSDDIEADEWLRIRMIVDNTCKISEINRYWLWVKIYFRF